MDVAAWNAKGGVVMSDGVCVRRVKEAVDLAVGVLEQFDLAHTKLVGLLCLGISGDLINRLGWKLQIVMKIHVSGHGSHSRDAQRGARRRPGRGILRGVVGPLCRQIRPAG
jgi:hypothetical protein